MPEVDIKELLKKVNIHIKDPDTIIDPYDMTYVWLSNRAKTFLGDNCVGKRVAMESKSSDGKDDYGRNDMVTVLNDYKVERRKIIIHTKSNERKEALIDYMVIKFNNQPYLATRVIR